LFYNQEYVLVFDAYVGAVGAVVGDVIKSFILTDFGAGLVVPSSAGLMTFEAFNAKSYPSSCIVKFIPIDSSKANTIVNDPVFNLEINKKLLRHDSATGADCNFLSTAAASGPVAEFTMGNMFDYKIGVQQKLSLLDGKGGTISNLTVNQGNDGSIVNMLIGTQGNLLYFKPGCSPYGLRWTVNSVSFYEANPPLVPVPSKVQPSFGIGCQMPQTRHVGSGIFTTQACLTDQCIAQVGDIQTPWMGVCPDVPRPPPPPPTPSDDNGGGGTGGISSKTIKNYVGIGLALLALALILSFLLKWHSTDSNSPNKIQVEEVGK
jgi:hypothetical protein